MSDFAVLTIGIVAIVAMLGLAAVFTLALLLGRRLIVNWRYKGNEVEASTGDDEAPNLADAGAGI